MLKRRRARKEPEPPLVPQRQQGTVLFGTTGTLVMDDVAVPIDVVFGYDSEDPFAVDLIASYGEFHASWLLSRNALLVGMRRATGNKAVKVRPRVDAEGRRYVAITLLSRDLGTVHVRAEDIARFLADTTAIVPVGQEDVALDVDTHLLKLLAGES